MTKQGLAIAVVIPSYKVDRHILSVISQIGAEVSRIYVVDDCCPDRSGDLVESQCSDKRVVVLRHAENQGRRSTRKQCLQKVSLHLSLL